MPSDAVIATTVNFEELQQAFKETPELSFRFAKTALFRFARRVAKRIKTDSLSGGSGIKGGPWRRIKDKNVAGYQFGTDLASLKAVNRVSRIVRTHVEGATITAKDGGFLFLRSGKHGKGTGKVLGRVRSVKIPARVKVEEPWRQEIPRGTQEIGDAIHGAMNLSLDQRMKVVSQYVNKIASHV